MNPELNVYVNEKENEYARLVWQYSHDSIRRCSQTTCEIHDVRC